MGAVKLGELEWAAAARAAARDAEPGDACLVKPVDDGVLIAVVDGLGHGPEAVQAAQRALKAIERSTQTLPAQLTVECHRALQATRGVVMGLAHIDAREDTLVWVGVGDVRALLCRVDPFGAPKYDALFTHNGVVGRTLPPLRPVTRSLAPGDTFIVTTDGIRGGFTPELRGVEPERVANALLERHAVATDDALVLVARYRGGPA
jgi:serine/threonine protein phosphatase PrpC